MASRAPCRRSHVPFFFTGRGRLLSLFRRPGYRGWCMKKNQCKCHLCCELLPTLKLTIILGGKRQTLARPISSGITLKFPLRLSWNPEMQSPPFRNGFAFALNGERSLWWCVRTIAQTMQTHCDCYMLDRSRYSSSFCVKCTVHELSLLLRSPPSHQL